MDSVTQFNLLQMSSSNIIRQSIVQYFAASIGGTALEYLLPPAAAVNDGTLLKTLLEVLAQLAANGLLTYHGFQALYQYQLIEADDPAEHITYFLALAGAQPNLLSKISALNLYYKRKLDSMHFGNAEVATPLHVGKQGNPVNQNNTANMVHTTATTDHNAAFTSLEDE